MQSNKEATRSQAVDLSAIPDAKALAIYLDIKPGQMTWCAHKTGECVTHHRIKTKPTKVRDIYAPNFVLKHTERAIERLLRTVELDDCVHGFVPGRSTVTNAAAHVGKDIVINIDLKDFFPSIGPKRVYGLFRRWFKMQKRVAWAAAQVCTYAGHLCQGFVTSPTISNILCWKMDRRLKALAASKGFTYTRYADDLTFSVEKWTGSVDFLIDAVKHISKEEGFEVNPRKIAIMRKGRRQKVTGWVVNDKLNLPRALRQNLRVAVDQWPLQTGERKAVIRGWISYLNAAQPELAKKLRDKIEAYESGKLVKNQWGDKKLPVHVVRKK